jgi:hypothetical protein
MVRGVGPAVRSLHERLHWNSSEFPHHASYPLKGPFGFTPERANGPSTLPRKVAALSEQRLYSAVRDRAQRNKSGSNVQALRYWSTAVTLKQSRSGAEFPQSGQSMKNAEGRKQRAGRPTILGPWR